MENSKRFLIPAYIVWSVISLLLVVAFIVINYCFEKPKTYGYEYFDKIKVEKVTSDGLVYEDEKPIIEVNYVRADTTNELYLTEVVITTYTDYNHTSYKRFGIQFVGNNYYYWNPDGKNYNENIKYTSSYLSSVGGNFNYSNNMKNVYFYELDVDSSVSKVMNFSSFEYDLDNLNLIAGEDSFVCQLGGEKAQYSYTCKYQTRSQRAKFVWTLGIWEKYTVDTHKIDYNSLDLFYEIATRFDTNYDDGTYSFKNLNLDKYFTIYKANNKKQFYTLSDVTQNTAYFSIKTNYKTITTGLKATDSIMGIVAGDTKYNAGVSNESKNSYSTSNSIKLTQDDFIKIANENRTGIVGLSNKFNSYLQSLNNLTVDIVLDLDDTTIKGLDISTLTSLNIKSITINSTDLKEFYIVGINKKITKSMFTTTLNLLNEQGARYE